jgi:NHLM bacteriocin system ABC transporter peptidase/ATP-binding protein
MNKRVRTPTLIQMEAVECGAASLGIILGYYGAFIPLEKLRYDCGISRDGSKASNIVKAARKYNLECKGYMCQTPDDLDNLFDKKFPFVVFWEMSHFLVVEGKKKNKVYLNDPSFGPRTVSLEEFRQSFSRVYLTFELTENFIKTKKPPNVLKGLLSRLSGSEKNILLAFLISLSLIIPGLVVPGMSKIFIDEYLLKDNKDYLNPILMVLILFFIASFILRWMQKTILARLETKLLINSSYNFMRHVLKLPMAFFSQRSVGDVISRLQANSTIASLLSGGLATTLLDLIQVVFFGIVMFFYSWQLTGIVALLAFVNIIVYKMTKRVKRDIGFRVQEANAKLLGTTIVGTSMVESLKSSGGVSDFYTRWSGFQAKYINAYHKQSWYTMLTSALPVLCTHFSSALVLGIGCLLIIHGQFTLGGLVAFQMLTIQFSGPIDRLVDFGGTLQQIAVDLKRLDDVHNYDVDYKHRNKDKTVNKPKYNKLTGRLELKNITFGYSRLEPPLVEDFNLSLVPGSRVALVGTSGSGKSTIANLVSGLYQAWSGEILFDETPIQDISPEILAGSLSMVNQDPFFFKGSIRENLTMWDNTIQDEFVTEAAQKAGIYEDIASRNGAFECQMDESGSNFSGGQLQRMEITRALINDPSLLIMDEATSALDPVIESKIDNNLRSLGCTSLIIAHRLSTIRDCDEIIVLSKGKVVERGTHEELMKNDGTYTKLVKSE